MGRRGRVDGEGRECWTLPPASTGVKEPLDLVTKRLGRGRSQMGGR